MSEELPNTLRSERVRTVLDRLHQDARGDWVRFLGLVPRLAAGLASGKSVMQSLTPSAAKNIYMPVSREQGQFLYLTARTIRAKRIVEFGTSFGISTLYLAAAVRDNPGAGHGR